MEFVTIHDLSRELNVPERVIRYRFIQLIAEAKLKEPEDFRRDDYKDEQHYVWKIQPLRFMQETGLKPAIISKQDTPLTLDNNIANQKPPVVNQPVNEPPKTVTQPVATIDTKDNDTAITRELIDILKDQIQVKDQQLREQGEQLKETQELNMKLVGTTLQQAQKIENLLRLTSGKSESEDVVIKYASAGNTVGTKESQVANQPEAAVHEPSGAPEFRQAA